MSPGPWWTKTTATLPSTQWRPFYSAKITDYLERYWAVVFTVGSRTVETGHMRHYASWYCTRVKVVLLDHHVHAENLRQQLVQVSDTSDLPLLFVNKKLVGTVQDIRDLERQRKLKDILHFGFEWQVGGEKSLTGTLPSPYGDTELFRGRYRGAPVARPIVALPKFHPLDHRSDE